MFIESKILALDEQNKNIRNEIINPAKGMSDYGWHFEQNVYSEDSLCRSIKASEGSGNVSKVIEVSKQQNKVQYLVI